MSSKKLAGLALTLSLIVALLLWLFIFKPMFIGVESYLVSLFQAENSHRFASWRVGTIAIAVLTALTFINFINVTTVITLSFAAAINLMAFNQLGIYAYFVALATVGMLVGSFKGLEANYYGEPRLFGWRAPWWMTVTTGWCLWPGTVTEFTQERTPFRGKAVFFASENLQLSEPWQMEIIIDHRITDKEGFWGLLFGRIKFLKVRDFPGNASQFMDSKLAKVGGISTREHFKERLKEVEDYLRCFMMLFKPPHPENMEHNSGDSPVLKWYKDNKSDVKKLLGKNAASHQYSPFERDYGVRVAIFRMTDPEYTPKTEQHLEAVEQQGLLAKAAEHQVEVAKKFSTLPSWSVAAAQRATGIFHNSQSVDISGLGENQPVFPVIQFGSQPGSKQGRNEPKKKGGEK